MREKISKEENYFAQVEEFWTGLAKRPLSPLEFEYLTSFFQTGIPLTAVILGICRTFRNFKPRSQTDHVRGLRYCLPEIFRASYEIWPEEYWEQALKDEMVFLKKGEGGL